MRDAEIPEIDIKIERVDLDTKSRKIKRNWKMLAEDDTCLMRNRENVVDTHSRLSLKNKLKPRTDATNVGDIVQHVNDKKSAGIVLNIDKSNKHDHQSTVFWSSLRCMPTGFEAFSSQLTKEIDKEIIRDIVAMSKDQLL